MKDKKIERRPRGGNLNSPLFFPLFMILGGGNKPLKDAFVHPLPGNAWRPMKPVGFLAG